MDGKNVTGVARIVFNLLSQPDDVHVDRTGEGNGLVSPDLVQQGFAGDDLTFVFDKVSKQA